MKILVTGTAGFIGFHLAQKLLKEGHEVVGFDNINDYYDVRIKYGRLALTGIAQDEIAHNKMVQSSVYPAYRFIKLNLEDRMEIAELFSNEQFDVVINLAAQAGVRYSLENPYIYVDSNVVGFMNILEGCRHNKVKHLVYASTSSVYGLNTNMPLTPHEATEHPMTLYAATKKANEMMAHSYSHLFGVPTSGLRFFTVYGPWGRPDMALFLFTKAMIEDRPIDIFNNGDMIRDFTYVDDIVEGISRVAKHAPVADTSWDASANDPATSSAPYRIYNIGNSSPVKLMDYIGALEKALNKEAKKNFMPMQLGDVPATHADMKDLIEAVDYKPDTSVQDGIKKFVDWYLSFYKN